MQKIYMYHFKNKMTTILLNMSYNIDEMTLKILQNSKFPSHPKDSPILPFG